MDIFLEKIVSKKKTIIDTIITIGCVIGVIIVIMVSSSIPQIASMWVLLSAGAGYGAYRLLTSRNIEFEYAVTNGDLDIDKIIAQRKRKTVFKVNCKEFEIVAPVNSEYYTPQIKSITNKKNFCSSMTSPNLYFISLRLNGESTVVYFEPSEKMLNNFKIYIPRKIHMIETEQV